MDASGAPLLPKLRGQFAEFLNRGSLVHLKGISLRLPVSVCGTGCVGRLARLEAFLGGLGTPALPPPLGGSPPALAFVVGAGFAWLPAAAGRPVRSIRPAAGPYRVPPSLAPARKCRTVHLLSIAYAALSAAASA
jgi:hypothetical protein